MFFVSKTVGLSKPKSLSVFLVQELQYDHYVFLYKDILLLSMDPFSLTEGGFGNLFRTVVLAYLFEQEWVFDL